MLGFIGRMILGGKVREVASGIREVSEVFRPNAEKQDARGASDISSSRAQYAAEFLPPTNWFDSFVNGLNRLVRPTFAFGLVYFLWLARYDPYGYLIWMSSLDAVPDFIRWAIGAVIGFYFTINGLDKARNWHVDKSAIKMKMDEVIRLEEMRHEREERDSQRKHELEIASRSTDPNVDPTDGE